MQPYPAAQSPLAPLGRVIHAPAILQPAGSEPPLAPLRACPEPRQRVRERGSQFPTQSTIPPSSTAPRLARRGARGSAGEVAPSSPSPAPSAPASATARLQPYFAAPHGDMMLSGCFGMLRAFAHRFPQHAPEIEQALDS